MADGEVVKVAICLLVEDERSAELDFDSSRRDYILHCFSLVCMLIFSWLDV